MGCSRSTDAANCSTGREGTDDEDSAGCARGTDVACAALDVGEVVRRLVAGARQGGGVVRLVLTAVLADAVCAASVTGVAVDVCFARLAACCAGGVAERDDVACPADSAPRGRLVPVIWLTACSAASALSRSMAREFARRGKNGLNAGRDEVGAVRGLVLFASASVSAGPSVSGRGAIMVTLLRIMKRKYIYKSIIINGCDACRPCTRMHTNKAR